MVERGDHIRGDEICPGIEEYATSLQPDDPFVMTERKIDGMQTAEQGLARAAAEIEQQVHDLFADLRIQAGDGFIGQDGFWILDQDPGDSHPLLLPAG